LKNNNNNNNNNVIMALIIQRASAIMSRAQYNNKWEIIIIMNVDNEDRENE